MFTREQHLEATDNTIRYISITGNEECTGNKLIEHLARDVRENIQAAKQGKKTILTILAVDAPHIYNIAVENGLAIEEITQHQDFLLCKVQQAFETWWNANEIHFLALLKRYNYKSVNIQLMGKTIETRLNEFNVLIQKIGINAEIIRWEQWLSLSENVTAIRQAHEKQYATNSAYVAGYGKTIAEFTKRRIAHKKVINTEKGNALTNDALTLAYQKSAEAYLITETPLTLKIAEELGYKNLHYAGAEPEAFIVTRKFLLTDAEAIHWIDSIKTVNNSNLLPTIDIEKQVNEITGFAKKIPKILQVDSIFIKLLSTFLHYAIADYCDTTNEEKDYKNYIEQLLKELKERTTNKNKLKITQSRSHENDTLFSQNAYSAQTNEERPPTPIINQPAIIRAKSVGNIAAQYTSVNIVNTFPKYQPLQIKELINNIDPPLQSMPFDFDSYLQILVQAMQDKIKPTLQNNKRGEKRRAKKDFSHPDNSSSLVEIGKTKFVNIINSIVNYTNNSTLQIKALGGCVQKALQKIAQKNAIADPTNLLQTLIDELASKSFITNKLATMATTTTPVAPQSEQTDIEANCSFFAPFPKTDQLTVKPSPFWKRMTNPPKCIAKKAPLKATSTFLQSAAHSDKLSPFPDMLHSKTLKIDANKNHTPPSDNLELKEAGSFKITYSY